VNHSTYLGDETGGRRFWPVRVERILVDELRRDRDQLWAEAVYRFRNGVNWWLDTTELNRAAEQEQAERYESDPWQSTIEEWIQDRPDVSIAEVLSGALDKPKSQWTQVDQNRVSRVLTALGWEKFQKRTGELRERRWRLKQCHG
jgi:predicted P-loop ATPase